MLVVTSNYGVLFKVLREKYLYINEMKSAKQTHVALPFFFFLSFAAASGKVRKLKDETKAVNVFI